MGNLTFLISWIYLAMDRLLCMALEMEDSLASTCEMAACREHREGYDAKHHGHSQYLLWWLDEWYR